MNYENVDPMLVQLQAQLLFMQKQLVNNPPQGIQVGEFIAALTDFINALGEETHRQAQP
jgi:hypothetical protein